MAPGSRTLVARSWLKAAALVSMGKGDDFKAVSRKVKSDYAPGKDFFRCPVCSKVQPYVSSACGGYYFHQEKKMCPRDGCTWVPKPTSKRFKDTPQGKEAAPKAAPAYTAPSKRAEEMQKKHAHEAREQPGKTYIETKVNIGRNSACEIGGMCLQDCG